MARNKIEKQTTALTGSLPFLDNYVNKNPDAIGKEFEILRVKETQSRAGWVIHTAEFMIHLYKSNDLVQQLVEQLCEIESVHEAGGFVILLDEGEEQGFAIIFDTEIKRTWVLLKKYGSGKVFQSEVTSVQVAGARGLKKR
jgi:hypothetical protein